MKKLFVLPLLAAIVAMAASTSALASPGGQPPIKVGPMLTTSADDTGTCNNTWAEDSFCANGRGVGVTNAISRNAYLADGLVGHRYS
jgi:hypothetical protein